MIVIFKLVLMVDAVAAANDNFYIKELPEMQEAGIVIVSD